MFGVDAHSARAHLLNSNADLHTDNVKSGETPAFGYRFNTLSAGGLTINNPDFRVLPASHASNIDHYGQILLGMPELRHFRIYIAYKEQVLYVTAADAH
jgi:hypothetical protein